MADQDESKFEWNDDDVEVVNVDDGDAELSSDLEEFLDDDGGEATKEQSEKKGE